MGIAIWLRENWFTLLQTLSITGGLLFSGISLRTDAKVRRVSNLFEITKQHREIWSALYSRPELKRVLRTSTEIEVQITEEEELFVNFLILHLATSYRAARVRLFELPTQLRADIKDFFSLPIPRAIWERAKAFQDSDYIAFVESRFG